MIRCDIHIDFIEEANRKGLSLAILPTLDNLHPAESRAWKFMDAALTCARDRVKAQMANLSKNSDEISAGQESHDLLQQRMKALGAGQRLTASFMLAWSDSNGLGYFLIRQPDERFHTIGVSVWRTIKTALDFVTDFFDRDGFGMSYEEDQRTLREELEEILAKLPLFPPLEKP